MKKLSIIFTVLLLAFNVKAQVSFGLQIGANSSNISYIVGDDFDGSDFDYPVKSKFGLNIGLVVDYAINDQAGLQTGLMYSQKGYQVDWDAFLKENDLSGDVEIEGYWKRNYNYLELPLHFYYNANGVKIFAGPYFAYGLSGSSDIDLTLKGNGDTVTMKEEFTLNPVSGDVKAEDFLHDGEDWYDIKVFNALDFGFDVGLGYQYEQFFAKLQYSIGMSNLTPGISDVDDFDRNDLKKTNKGISFSVTYFFTPK